MTAEEIRVDPSRVRLMRKQQRWTQDEMSQAAGLSLRTIQRAEDSGRVSLATLKSLAAVLEVDASELEATEPISLPPLLGKTWPAYVAGALAVAVALFWVTGVTERSVPMTPVLPKEIVVVLPFNQFAGDSQSSAMADMLTHELILSLSKSGQANVISERDSRIVSGHGETVKQISDAVSASLVVEGSVRSIADRFRVTVQVLDTESAAHLWSETYDREEYQIDGLVPDIRRSIEAVYRN